MPKFQSCPFCHRDTASQDHREFLHHVDTCHKVQNAIILRFYPDAAIARDDEGGLHWLEYEQDEDSMSRLASFHPLQHRKALQQILSWMRDTNRQFRQLRRAAEFLAREVEPDGAVTIEVKGGLVQDVTGLPNNWSYAVLDWDTCPACGTQDPDCPDCKEKN